LNSFESAKICLVQELKNLLKGHSEKKTKKSSRNIIRLEVPLQSLDLLFWLKQQKNSVKNYWSSRDGSFESAGIGASHIIKGSVKSDFSRILPDLKNILVSNFSDARYFGGIQFQHRLNQEDIWQAFGCCLFNLPLIEIVRDGEDYSLAANLYVPSNEAILDRIENLITFLNQTKYNKKYFNEDEFARLISRDDIPDIEGWHKKIKMVLKEFESGSLQKIVLARKSNLRFAGSIDPVSLLEQLKRKSGQAFHFLFQPVSGTAFIGASPECLYKRNNGKIYSEALAGTRPRGTDQFMDITLEKELRTDLKEIREHQWVSKMVNDALHPLCDEIETIDEMSIIKLSNVQHLISRFRGHLQNGVEDFRIIQQLHPTPAVGGTPRDLALKGIIELESFDRGWYAGPVGWFGRNSSEFSVAIRSALVTNGSIALYAGSGIVAGSKPEAEWEETENKILNFKKLLQIK
jgi:menaquinone-specific isochorismate synthase